MQINVRPRGRHSRTVSLRRAWLVLLSTALIGAPTALAPVAATEWPAQDYSRFYVRGALADERIFYSHTTDHIVDGVTMVEVGVEPTYTIHIAPASGEQLEPGVFPVITTGEPTPGQVLVGDMAGIPECPSAPEGQIEVLEVAYDGDALVSLAARYLISCSATLQVDGYVWHNSDQPFRILFTLLSSTSEPYGHESTWGLPARLHGTESSAATITSINVKGPDDVEIVAGEDCIGVTLNVDDSCTINGTIFSTREDDGVILIALDSPDVPLGTSGLWPLVLRTLQPWEPTISWSVEAFDGVAMSVPRSGQQDVMWWRRLAGESEWKTLDALELIMTDRLVVVDHDLAPGESAEYRVENRWLPESPSFSEPVTLTRPVSQPSSVLAVAAVSVSYQGGLDASKSWSMQRPSSARDPADSAVLVRAPWGIQSVIFDSRLPDAPGTYSVGGSGERSVSISTGAGLVSCSDGVLEVRDSITRAIGQFYRADMTLQCSDPMIRANIRVGAEVQGLPGGFVPRPIGESAGQPSGHSSEDPATRQLDLESEPRPLDVNALQEASTVFADEEVGLPKVDAAPVEVGIRDVGWFRFVPWPV